MDKILSYQFTGMLQLVKYRQWICWWYWWSITASIVLVTKYARKEFFTRYSLHI